MFKINTFFLILNSSVLREAYTYLTPKEYFTLIFLISDKKQDIEIIEKYSTILSFNDYGKPIRKLSSGNQKKVGLISTLITNPEIIIWDEPFANLDEESSYRLNELIIELSKNKKTLIYSEHTRNETYDTIRYDV